jgi:hypothetical protein
MIDTAALRRNAEAATKEREPDPGQQWKCGDEFMPFHPQSSLVPPDYRDGWNRCYCMAAARLVPLLDELDALRAQQAAPACGDERIDERNGTSVQAGVHGVEGRCLLPAEKMENNGADGVDLPDGAKQ